MRWVPSTIILFIGTVISLEEDNSNEVVIGSSIKPPINLDTNLRKALLKALIELENDDKENYDRNTRNEYVNIITHLDNRHKNVEKASATAVSYITKSEPVNMTITVKKTTSKPKQIVVVQKSKRFHERKKIDDDLDVSETPDHFIASASSSFTSSEVNGQKGELKSSPGVPIPNSLTQRINRNKARLERPTTVRPTTSTEENEANVESLQFFSAPLVAAFTVHQDEKGLPKSVVPIYNQLGVLTGVTAKPLEKEKKLRDELKHNVLKQQESLVTKYEVELKQRQNKLEEEIRRLTKLQEEQERIIREQKFAYERKIFEQQKKLFAEQTRLFNNVQPFIPVITTTPKPTFNSPNQQNNIENLRNNAATLVSVQPSFGFVQPSSVNAVLPLAAQILPVRKAIDFRTPFAQNFRQFREQRDNIIPNSQPTSPNRSPNTEFPVRSFFSTNTIVKPAVPFRNNVQSLDFSQGLPSFEQRTSFRQNPSVSQTFSQSQNLPFASLPSTFRITEITPEQHGSRSLRQETGTGNFINNNRLNSPAVNFDSLTDHRFNRNFLSPVAGLQTTEVIRPNLFGAANPPRISQYNTLQYSVDEPFVNQRLNNLLYFSGLGQGRQQEDLNIVSKVLSLNHLSGGDSQFASSNIDSQRIRPGTSWRVI